MATGASAGTNEATVSRWPAEISGPIWVVSSSGSPTRICCTSRSSASRNGSTAERSTRMRERAQQSCPALPNTATGAAAAAFCMSASAKITFADLPPSSSVTRLIVPAAPWAIPRPTPVEPVNAIFATSGCSTMPPADHAARPGDDVQHSLRQARVEGDPLQLERGQRRQLGRLQHDRVAGRERGRHLPGGDHEREVPRHDQARPRRAARGRSCRSRRPQGSSVPAAARARPRSSGSLRRPSPSRRARRRSASRRCAPRGSRDPRRAPRARRRGGGAARPVAGRHRAPRRERGLGARDRGVDLVGARARHLRHHLLGGRLYDRSDRPSTRARTCDGARSPSRPRRTAAAPFGRS